MANILFFNLVVVFFNYLVFFSINNVPYAQLELVVEGGRQFTQVFVDLIWEQCVNAKAS